MCSSLARNEDDKQQSDYVHKYQQIVSLINNAQSIKDLDCITYKLLSLSELKQLLLDKLAKLKHENDRDCDGADSSNTNNTNNTNSTLSSSPSSLHSLYYTCTPFDEIFSDDVICSIVQYLASPSDDDVEFNYHKLPLLNRHFNTLMRHRTVLYQQYKICVPLNDELWKKRKSLVICISHQTKSIYIMDPVNNDHEHYSFAPLFLANKSTSKYNIEFEILNLDDMNSKCPFVWHCCKKWQIQTSIHLSNRLYSHNLYQYYNAKRVERANRTYSSNDFSGYVSPTDSLDLTPTYRSRRSSFFSDGADGTKHSMKPTKSMKMDILTENNSIMKQLLDKAMVHIRSIVIDDGEHDNSSSAAAKRRTLKNFYWLNKVFHLKSVAHDFMRFYSLKQLRYLELMQIHHAQEKMFEALRELKQLLVLKLDLHDHDDDIRIDRLEDDRLERMAAAMAATTSADAHSSGGGDGGGEEKAKEQQWLITLPMNVEFVQICNFCNASNYLLNFCDCKHLVAIVFKNSKIYEWSSQEATHHDAVGVLDALSIYRPIEQCLIWPTQRDPIECVLFDNGAMNMQSIDHWYAYFARQRMNAALPPIKYLRYRVMPMTVVNLHPPPGSDAEAYMVEADYKYNDDEDDTDTFYVPLVPPVTPPSKSNGLNNNNTKKLTQYPQNSNTNNNNNNGNSNALNAAERDAEISCSSNLSGTSSALSATLWLDEQDEMKMMTRFTEDYVFDKYVHSVHEEYVLEEEQILQPPYTALPLPPRVKLIDMLNAAATAECGANNEMQFCSILDVSGCAMYHGLLWKLLLMRKHKNGEDDLVQDRLSMYREWFAMDIAKWIYYLGYWSEDESQQFVPSAFVAPMDETVESPRTVNVHAINLKVNVNAPIATTMTQRARSRWRGVAQATVNNVALSTPNVPRRSTVNTSPTASTSHNSVVDSLQLYLPVSINGTQQ